MDVNAAQNRAKQKLQDAQKTIDDAKAAAAECAAEMNNLQTKINGINKSLLRSGDEKTKKQEEINSQIKTVQQERLNKSRLLDDMSTEIAKEQNSLFFVNTEKIENLKQEMIPIQNDFNVCNARIENLRKELSQYELTEAEKNAQNLKNDLTNQLDEKKNGEYKQANEAIETAEKAKAALGYNEDDIDELAQAALAMDNKANKYNVGQTRASKDAKSQQLMDLRNLPGGINFRSGQTAMRVSVGGDDGSGNGILSPSKSYYMNQDYLFTNSLASPVPLGRVNCNSLPEVQTLIINEFQPYEMLSVADLLPGAANILIDVAQKTVSLAGGFIVNAAKTAIINNEIDKVSADPSSLYSKQTRERKYFTSDPVQQVENMFNGGKWLNTYEVPFYGKDYLKGQTGSWQLGGAKESFGSIGGFMQSMGIDFPSNPKFKIDMKSASDRKISTEFYLINSNDKWLLRNFQFLNAIYAGTTWLHMKYCLIRPTNVYHVLCPGRFQMLWARMKSEITFEGKLRKNITVSRQLKGMGINSIDDDMLWPDAWKIKLDIEDFTPNNFNMYADYYMNGYNADEIQSLAEKIGIEKMVGDLAKYMGEVYNDTVNAGKGLLNGISESNTAGAIRNAFSAIGQEVKEDGKSNEGGNQ